VQPLSDASSGGRPLSRGMRALLVVAGVLVVLAGVQVFVFPLRTAEWFAWTINPPMTAVFLGASYWSSAAVEWTAATRRTWAEARVAVPGVFVFTTLTLVVTLVHLDRFHLGSEHAPATRAVTWVWIAIYAAVPVLMAVLWWRQSRLPGADPPRRRPLPRLVRATLLAQALVLVPLGIALLVAPEAVAPAWPWALSALTGRAVGAWLLSLGVVAAHALREGDVARILPATIGSLVFVVLQGVALLRHGSDLTGGAGTLAYGLLLATFVVTGPVALILGRRVASR
jgi:hypothetical protein